MGWSETQVTVAFTIMMALAGTSAAFFGKFVEKNGPRKSAMVAAILFGLGQAGSGLAIQIDSVFTLLAYVWGIKWYWIWGLGIFHQYLH